MSFFLCAVLFMLTGDDPYKGLPTGRIIHMKMNAGDAQVEIPEALAQSADPRVGELVRIIRRCTRFDRKQR